MTFFEQELRKLFADGAVIKNPRFAGRACFGTLGKDLRVRVQFVTSGHADHYDAMSVSVLNRTDGVVDKLRIRLKDVLGIKPVPGNPNFRNGMHSARQAPTMTPCGRPWANIWTCSGNER